MGQLVFAEEVTVDLYAGDPKYVSPEYQQRDWDNYDVENKNSQEKFMEKQSKGQKNISKNIVKGGMYLLILLGIAGISTITGLFETFSEVVPAMKVNIYTVIRVICMACFVMVVYHFVQFMLTSLKPKKKRSSTIIAIILSLTQYVAAIVMICWGLTLLGVNVSTIFASIGLLALIVGFGAESLITDVITGVFMLFENQYNVGDIIEVNGFRGTVVNIGIRTTSIEDSGKNIKIVNNSSMVNILNRSAVVSKAVCDIGIPYEEDLEEVEKLLGRILGEIYKRHEDVMNSCPIYSGVQELAESAVMLRIVVDVNEKNLYSAARILNREILLAFKESGISIPYRQLDIHTRN